MKIIKRLIIKILLAVFQASLPPGSENLLRDSI